MLARKHGQPVPEDGYPGQFVAELAARYDGPDDAAEAGRWGGEQVLADIKTTLESINIHYDEWYSQASIEESGAVAETIEVLRAKGLIFDREGATWLRTADFGDPRKERVVIKSNGDFTYLGGDIAYHRNKFMIRGYDRVIDVWGADHQAQVPSLLAAVEALGVRSRPARGEDRPDGLPGVAAACRSASGTPWISTSSSRTSVPMRPGCSPLLSSVDSRDHHRPRRDP